MENSSKQPTIEPKQFDYKSLLPNLPNNLPQEPYEFEPPLPSRNFFVPVFSPKLLARRIYNDMLSVIRDYGMLIAICGPENRSTLESLKSQMQILSIAMLNIYQNISGPSRIPFLSSSKPQIPKDCKKALQLVYDRVYAIHRLVLRLFTQNLDQQSTATLLVVLSNLKSQLKTLDKLIKGS